MSAPARINVSLKREVHRLAKIESSKEGVYVTAWIEDAVLKKLAEKEKGE